jgi:hypothetical protein
MAWYFGVNPAINVLGMSRRAPFVSSAASRISLPGSGTARRRKVAFWSSLRPSRFSSASISSQTIGFSASAKSGSSAPFPGAVST